MKYIVHRLNDEISINKNLEQTYSITISEEDKILFDQNFNDENKWWITPEIQKEFYENIKTSNVWSLPS